MNRSSLLQLPEMPAETPRRARRSDAGADDEPGAAAQPVRFTAWLAGRVQGVGIRWWVAARALELGLAGWADNLDDGRVKVVAEGRGRLRAAAGPAGQATAARACGRVTHRWDGPRAGAGFPER